MLTEMFQLFLFNKTYLSITSFLFKYFQKQLIESENIYSMQ